MTTAQMVFLYAAEERSISRAAARAYVSQQCASRHIANLEKEYGTPLVIRKPVFTLTEAGEVLAASLSRMLLLEQETARYIEDISEGSSGQITIGMNMTRAEILLPQILPKYRKRYPNVRITVRSGDTEYLAALLKKGEIDMMVGVNLSYDPQLEVVPLSEDRILFMTTASQLQALLPERAEELLRPEDAAGRTVRPDTPQATISFQEIRRFPLCRNLPDSTLTQLLDRVTAAQNIPLAALYECSDYHLQIRLCGTGLASTLCPETVLPLVRSWNEANRSQGEDEILAFAITGLTETLKIDLIMKRESIRPGYAKAFAGMMVQV